MKRCPLTPWWAALARHDQKGSTHCGKEYRVWICKIVFDCYLFYNESTDELLIVDKKTNLLKEHLRTRLQHDLPRAVLACTVLVDSSANSYPPARLSIPVTFYVQTKNTTAIPLEAWIGDGSVWSL
jgi:hypothetical protein